MPLLLDKSPDPKKAEKTMGSSTKLLLPVSLFFTCLLLVIVASFQNSSKTDEEKLEELQAKIEKRVPLQKFEKEAYCELLWKVKQINLCACKKNFIKDIGSLTGYDIQDSDLDWRDSGKTFDEALQEAFRRTGVPKEQFEAKEWGLDLNGKSGVVKWEGPGGAEVSVDAPHTTFGPDVFHIGFQSRGKKDQVSGHIFLDCVPYFRKKP
ncbi:MAG: hypothetical protein IPQ05_11090 [Leptospiraceae bacterium]|nr:hypothetical protein [Leptospiraceae bacterium]MBK7056152.1 hypothetical protein [Leptospiraceae bacterium]MBL0264403.1 hypothetical protein [Leptospiraceae bacterium]MBP9889877.1 hypothetical protein [Leptospiraceae bacterium]